MTQLIFPFKSGYVRPLDAIPLAFALLVAVATYDMMLHQGQHQILSVATPALTEFLGVTPIPTAVENDTATLFVLVAVYAEWASLLVFCGVIAALRCVLRVSNQHTVSRTPKMLLKIDPTQHHKKQSTLDLHNRIKISTLTLSPISTCCILFSSALAANSAIGSAFTRPREDR